MVRKGAASMGDDSNPGLASEQGDGEREYDDLDEERLWNDVFSGDPIKAVSGLSILSDYYHYMGYNFVLRALMAGNALAYVAHDDSTVPVYERIAANLYWVIAEQVCTKALEVVNTSPDAQVGARKRYRSFGAQFHRTALTVLDGYYAAMNAPAWRPAWITSPLRQPLGDGSLLTYEDMLCHPHLHCFMRAYQRKLMTHTLVSKSFTPNEVYSAVNASLVIVRDHLSATYHYMAGAYAIDALLSLTIKDRQRLTLYFIWGLDVHTIALLLPFDSDVGAANPIDAIVDTPLLSLPSSYQTLFRSDIWRQMSWRLQGGKQ